MEEHYSINEILNAINDLSDIKKKQVSDKNPPKKSDIPPSTLRLIEEAEQNVKNKNLIK